MSAKSMFEKLGYKIINKIFRLKCPSCGGRLFCEFYDMEIDKFVYKCEKCNKQWI